MRPANRTSRGCPEFRPFILDSAVGTVPGAGKAPQRRSRESGSPYKSLFQHRKWIPAFEHVKNSPDAAERPPIRGRSVMPAKAGIHVRACSNLRNWFPLSRERRCGIIAGACAFDFFTRSFARMTLRSRIAVLHLAGDTAGAAKSLFHGPSWRSSQLQLPNLGLKTPLP